MFRALAPIIRRFKTSTAATGTCVIVAGQSSHLLIRAFGPNKAGSASMDALPANRS